MIRSTDERSRFQNCSRMQNLMKRPHQDNIPLIVPEDVSGRRDVRHYLQVSKCAPPIKSEYTQKRMAPSSLRRGKVK